jgi:general secretion pathway protein D
LVKRFVMSSDGPRIRCIARRGAALSFFAAVSLLAACGVGNYEVPDPADARPPSVLDRVRALDLLPRFPGQGETVTPNAPRPSRAIVYTGTGDAAVADVQRAEGAASDEGYDLNFENAPVSTLAKVVLGDILGVGYTIDPRVQGTISLASGRPVPKSDILYVLENALRLSNVALVRDRTGYRLMPAGEAIGTGAVDRVASAEPGYGITVIPLRYVSAQTVIKLVDSFATKPGAMRADAARNILIVQGSGSERKAAVDIVASFDADWMRGQSVGVFPVRNSTPEPIIAEMEKIMDAGDGGLGQGVVKFQAVARLNAIMVVSRKPELLKSAGSWIARLDQSDTAGTNLKVYRLRYGNARVIAGLLNDIFVGRSPGGLESAAAQIAPGAGASTSTSSGALAALSFPTPGAGGAGAGAQPATTAMRPTPATSAAEAARTAEAARGGPGGAAADTGLGGIFGGGQRGPTGPGILPGVRITADVTNNSILVYANQESHLIVEQTLRQIDRPPLQVAIEATIAEVTLNDQLNYGVQFFLKSATVGLPADRGSIVNTLASIPISRVLPGFNFLIGSETDPRMILDALHTVTDVKVLSNPSLVVLDNQAATLQVGDSVPISTGTATVLTANNTVVNTIDYRNTGIILRVIPRVSSDGSVVLDIEQEISNVTPQSTGTLTPTVSQRRVKSSIAVASGQTVLLAGLISETENLTRPGIPVLDQIPAIGNLFAHQNKSIGRTELIIFIRPQIIRDPVDANVVAEELRTKLNGRLIGYNNKRPVGGTAEGPIPIR